MVSLEKAVVARFEHSGHRFEVLVDPDLAFAIRQGQDVKTDSLLANELVYKDANKTEEASSELVQKTFGTTDVLTVALRIIKDGNVQLTTEQKRHLMDVRKKEIVNFIVMNAINPQTSAPHPPQRIENALSEIRFQPDLFKSTQEQVNEALKEIRKLIPISLEKLRVVVRIPTQYAAKCTPIFHQYGVQKEEWQNDGSLVGLFELPVGLKQDLFNKLNSLTQGNVESKLLPNK